MLLRVWQAQKNTRIKLNVLERLPNNPEGHPNCYV